jgi:hypothetical protein
MELDDPQVLLEIIQRTQKIGKLGTYVVDPEPVCIKHSSSSLVLYADKLACLSLASIFRSRIKLVHKALA